jgi:glycerate 2-kinase
MKNLKEEAKQIFLATLRSIDLEAVIKQKVNISGDSLIVAGKKIDLSQYKEVTLVGLGKASLRMGAILEEMLGERIGKGILVTNHRERLKLKSEIIVGGHPLPTAESLAAGERILEMVEQCSPDSLIIFLISGGGSALVEAPASPDITLEDLQSLNQILISCGASIREINTVRKYLSRIKGGRLGLAASHAGCIALYLSDVNPGDLRSIASNPLLPESVTIQDFLNVIEAYRLNDRLPATVSAYIKRKEEDHPQKEWRWDASRCVTELLLDNRDAMEVAAEVARRRGFQVAIDSDHAEGGYERVADELIEMLLELRSRSRGKPVCLISGGEVSCPVRGKGTGGRNQEFVLYSAAQLEKFGFDSSIAVLSCGSDGIDGNSTAAGAAADAQMVREAARRGLDATVYIKANDSHTFFKQAGGLVSTGPTGNNVRDLRIFLAI